MGKFSILPVIGNHNFDVAATAIDANIAHTQNWSRLPLNQYCLSADEYNRLNASMSNYDTPRAPLFPLGYKINGYHATNSFPSEGR